MKNSLLKRHILVNVFFALIMLAAIGTLSAYMVQSIMMDHYDKMIIGAAGFIGEEIPGELVLHYAETRKKDDEYYQVLDSLKNLTEEFGFTYCYVCVPEEGGYRYVWDGSRENAVEIGTYDAYVKNEKERIDEIMTGKKERCSIIFTDQKYENVISAMAPVYDCSHKAVAIVYAEYSLKKVHDQILKMVLVILVILIAITALAVALFFRYENRHFILPVKKLSRDAESILDYMETKEPYHSDIHTGDEIEGLSLSFEAMSRDLLAYIEENSRIILEKERVNTELRMASAIQTSQLPDSFEAFRDRAEFDLFASMKPAREVGGDFYDFFMVDDDHVALVIADVCGKGVPAALFMMVSKTLLKNELKAGKSPAEALQNVNTELLEKNTERQFVTVWLSVFEISTGRGTEANAGHEHPALRRLDGRYELIEYKHSPALAVTGNAVFKNYDYTLYPGESLFVYTDGVTEVENSVHEQFGTTRMLEALNSVPEASPEAVIDTVYAETDAFMDGAEQYDDITMLCFRYNGRKAD